MQAREPHQLTFRHRAGVTPYTSSYEFAECCVFNKQSQPPGFCDLSQLKMFIYHQKRRTFSRSYGTILPSSFTRVLSCALVFSTCLPVSVCGTVLYRLSLSGFSWKPSIGRFSCLMTYPLIASALTGSRICLKPPPTRKYRVYQPPAQPSFLRPHIASIQSPGIFTWFPSTTHFCLALGADLPCSD